MFWNEEWFCVIMVYIGHREDVQREAITKWLWEMCLLKLI